MNHKTIVILPVLGIGVCVVAYGLTKGVLTGHGAGNRPAVLQERGASASRLPLIEETGSKKPLSQYLAAGEAGLFEPPGAGAQMEEDPFDLDALFDDSTDEPSTPAPPTPAPDPLADYVYAGTVSIDGRYAALMENRKTKVGVFLHEGDPFEGGVVGPITDRHMSITTAGNLRQIAKTEDYRLTPLSSNAAFLGNNAPGGTAVASNPSNNMGMPGGPPGAMPGMPGGMPGRPGGFGGGGMMGNGMRFGGGQAGSPMTFQMSTGGGASQPMILDGGAVSFELAVPTEATVIHGDSIQIIK